MQASSTSPRKKKSRIFRVIIWIFSILLFIVIAIYIAFQVSPWPSVLLIRYSFANEGTSVNTKNARYVPKGVFAQMDVPYSEQSKDTKLDLFAPEKAKSSHTKYPLVIWVHGGGFIGGDKKDIVNYCKLLAANGFIVAAANYSVAPSSKYPVPVNQINTAIKFLVKHADRFAIDTSNIILAGDSGGAHIAAQLAAIFSDTAYANALNIYPSVSTNKLKGVILHCGPYNTELINFDGSYSWFLKTVLWAYVGAKDIDKNDPRFKYFSVSNFVTEKFPRTFISVGNLDPLSVHSHDLASKLSAKGVSVDSLFFPKDLSPGLPHEYQFDLDNPASKLAFRNTIKFLLDCVKPK